MATVLVLDGDTRQALPVMRALRAGGHRITVACESRLGMGWLSRFPHRRVLVPSAEKEPAAFVSALLELLRREPHDVTIPLFDLCAHLVAEHKPTLERHTRVPLVDLDVFMLARDKANTMRICQERGIPCPRTWFPEEQPIEAIAAEVTWPVLVKPRIAHGAMGIRRAHDAAGLAEVYAKTVEEYGPSIVQEFIPQTDLQYKAQLFRDRDGSYKAAVVFNKLRYFPVTGGTSSANATVQRDDILESCRQLLDAMNWTSYADVDLIQDPRDGIAKVMEINPRVTGSVKIAFVAGVDFADLLVRYALGQPLPSYERYRVGVTMRYMPLDILWFLYSPDRFRAKPSWFKFWGRELCEQVFTLDDPLPFFGLFVGGVARLMSPKVRAAKLIKADHRP
jgi:predicted ATP-grasp superfamily ATP-dependent carboligase